VTRIQAGESRSSLIVSWRNPNDLVWLPWSWLLLLFVSNIKPTTRDAREAMTGSASVDNLIELGVYGLIAAGCIAALARHRHSPTRSAGVMMLTSFGLLAVASAAWSSVPVFSVVRGSQIIVVALLTIVSVEAWRSKLRDVVADWIRIWQGYAIVVMALVVFGVLMGPSESRFRWPGTEPIIVGSYLALAAVVVLSMLLERGWRFPRPKLALMSVLVVVFVTFMLVNTTRSTLAGFAVGAIAVYLTRSARRLDLRWLIVPFAGLAGAIAAILYSDALASYVLRGQSVEQFATLSDRTAIWSTAWEQASNHLVFGGGYGAGRVLFLDLFEWAGSAHSLWAELLVDLGLIGAALGLGLLLWSISGAVSLQTRAPGPIGSASLGVLLTTAIAGLAETGFAFPGLPLTVLALTIAGLTAGRTGTYVERFSQEYGDAAPGSQYEAT